MLSFNDPLTPQNMVPGRDGVPARLPELDGVRGVAIFLVLVWHYIAKTVVTTAGSPARGALEALSFTWAGVDLFFVLSGFLIGGILIDNRSSPHYFQAFYARRFFRIFPLYYASLGFFALAVAARWETASPGFAWLFGSPFATWEYATYLQNFSMAANARQGPNWIAITWSLAVEEQFYLVLPLAVWLLAPTRLRLWLIILVISAPVFRTAVFSWYPHGGAWAAYVLLPARWDALFLGVLGAMAVRQAETREWLAANRGIIRAVVLCSLLVVTHLFITGQGVFSRGMSLYGYTFLAIMFLGVLLLAVLPPNGVTHRLFRHKLFVWMGTISYGAYLIHQPMLGLTHALVRQQRPRIADPFDALITGGALFLTLLVASLSWRLLEAPIVRYGRRIRYED